MEIPMTAAAGMAPHDGSRLAAADESDIELGRSGMWLFLGTEVLFFGGLFVAYTWGRFTWPDGFADASRHTHVVIGTVNTGLLLTSSALVALAVLFSEAPEQRRNAGWLLAAAAALGIAFLGLKGFEYMKEFQEHLVPGLNFRLANEEGAVLFFVLYFVMTGLHALHLAIGVVVLGVFALGCHRERPWALPRRVEIAGLYWHFIDVVWIVLYPLLYLVSRHA